jgi:hypothetical protein
VIGSSLIWGAQGRRRSLVGSGHGIVNIDLTPEFVARLGRRASTLKQGAEEEGRPIPHRAAC